MLATRKRSLEWTRNVMGLRYLVGKLSERVIFTQCRSIGAILYAIGQRELLWAENEAWWSWNRQIGEGDNFHPWETKWKLSGWENLQLGIWVQYSIQRSERRECSGWQREGRSNYSKTFAQDKKGVNANALLVFLFSPTWKSHLRPAAFCIRKTHKFQTVSPLSF